MKPIAFILSLSLIIGLSSCHEQEVNRTIPDGDMKFYITGVSQSLTYTFTSGRQDGTPDDVRELNILIVDENDSVVYEQWYYNHNYYAYQDTTLANGDVYYYENTIPDTLFIPALPSGNYDILASTTYLNYWSDYIMNPDGTWVPGPMMYPRIEPYNVSENPIYVGKTNMTLTEDNQEVVVDMRNISARITLSKVEGSTNIEGGHLELIFNTKNNKYFSFAENALIGQEFDYDYQIYTYLFEKDEKHFYILPKTLSSVTIANFHDVMEEYNFRIEVPIDPDIDMQINDAVLFTINIDDILNGANRGAVLWPDITWNDKGEISIP